MDTRGTEISEEESSTPEDVAALYAWANLRGAKYRDFSASRREYRAQVRFRAAEMLRERELLAQAEAEAAAEAADLAAQAAAEQARSPHPGDSQATRLYALRSSEAATRKAAAERLEAARCAARAAQADSAAERERREMLEAHTSAQRQTASYVESEARRRQLAGPQPRELGDPYTQLNQRPSERVGYNPTLDQDRAPVLAYAQSTRYDPASEAEPIQPTLDFGLGSSPVWRRQPRQVPNDHTAEPPVASDPLAATDFRTPSSAEQIEAAERPGPAWLYSSPPSLRTRTTQPAIGHVGGDTLQDSRERVASRWFALKGIFEQGSPELPSMPPHHWVGDRKPVLLVFSMAGGTGKTSLVATLGRALATQGEKVVLTDTTSHGLLPFYFGARDLPSNELRSFPPPDGSPDPAISLVGYDMEASLDDRRLQETMAAEIMGAGSGSQRIVLDLGAGAGWMIRRMADLHPIVLVPMSPDMNSVISLQAVERFFQGLVDGDNRPLLPFYILNQFDASLPLHLDVREVFRRRIGDRLLRLAVRRSPAVGEALAEGMTVIDYAPDSAVAQDYRDLASWLRDVAPPASHTPRGRVEDGYDATLIVPPASSPTAPRWSDR